jgi:hypothetical protein
MSKYVYAVSFTILATIESDEPLAEEEIISQAELETCVTRDLCNDIDITGLYGTPTPY